MKSITRKKEFIAQSIDETKKRIDLFGQSMMILCKKKKKKVYRRNLLNYLTTNVHSLITNPFSSPTTGSTARNHQIPSPLTRSRNEQSFSSISLCIFLNRIIRSILLSSFRLKFGRLFLLLLGQRNRRMIVKPLGHQLKGERILLPARLLDLRPLVLKPDLDLRLVQAQIPRELLPPPLGQVSILRELPLQPGQLFAAERRPRPFLLRGAAIATAVRPLHPSRARTCNTVRSYCQLISVEMSAELVINRGQRDKIERYSDARIFI